MNFTLLGWNFRSTPLEIRDRLSLTVQEQLELIQQINARCGIQESVLLSTCNRTELYLYNMEQPADELLKLLQKRSRARVLRVCAKERLPSLRPHLLLCLRCLRVARGLLLLRVR